MPNNADDKILNALDVAGNSADEIARSLSC